MVNPNDLKSWGVGGSKTTKPAPQGVRGEKATTQIHLCNMSTTLNYCAANTLSGPPTRQQKCFSHSVTTTSFLGATVTTDRGKTWWTRAKDWISRHRAMGAVVAVSAAVALPVAPVFSALTAAGLLAGVAACRPDERFLVPDLVESMVADVVGLADCTEVGVAGRTKTADSCLDDEAKGLTAAARKWVQRVKLHFGEVKDTPADLLCVKRWLAEQMKAEDMRDKDARGLIPVVAVLATVPDQDDILGNMVRQSAMVSNARFLGGVGRKC